MLLRFASINDRATGPIGIIHQAECKSRIFAIFVRFRVTPDGKSGIFRVFVRFRVGQMKSVIHEGAKWPFMTVGFNT